MIDTNPQALLYAALAKAQGEVRNAHKNAKGQVAGNRDYKYADLAAIDEAIGEALQQNGLAIVQLPGIYFEGSQQMMNIVTHEGGGEIRQLASIPCRNDVQGAGSGLTYLRRYSLAAIMRVVTEDDDGKGAMPRNTPMVQAARDMGLTPANDASSPPAPSGERTRPIGAFTVRDLQPTYKALGFPSLGIVGAFLSGEPKNIAPTDELLEPWQEQNPTGTMQDLLVESANWFIENGKGDKTKSDLAEWLGSQS